MSCLKEMIELIIHIDNKDLSETLQFAKELDEIVPDSKMIFDFTKMHKFDPLPMLFMGASIRHYINKFPQISFNFTGVDNGGKNYAGTMGFFKYISSSLEIGKKPGEANGSQNYIPITPIVIDELQKKEYAKGNYMVLGELIEAEAS